MDNENEKHAGLEPIIVTYDKSGKRTRQELIQEWSKIYGRPLSEVDYDEICSNLEGAFSLLEQWDRESRTHKKEV